MIIALIITQFVGIPFSYAFGSLAQRLGAKRSILLALVVYTVISIAGFFMRTAIHFYILAFMVGTVQGGSRHSAARSMERWFPRASLPSFLVFIAQVPRLPGSWVPCFLASSAS
jgi:UMF1 family MFS transporter